MIKQIRSLYYDLIYGIYNIFTWLPTIWGDRNWDSLYVYNLLYKKIQLMEKHNKLCDQYIGQEKALAEIKEVKEILKRIVEGEYLTNALKPVEEKYGDWHFESEAVEGKPLYRFIDNRSEEHKIAWRKASDESNRLEEQDKDNLFKLLRKNLDGWWT